MSLATNYNTLAHQLPTFEHWKGEDPSYKGIMSGRKEKGLEDEDEDEKKKKKKIIEGAMPKVDDEMNKHLYNRSVDQDPVARNKANSKRYGVAVYLGKDDNEDKYLKKEGAEGHEAFLVNVADSATSDGLGRSTVSDYAKQSGLNNAMKELNDEGVKLTSQINSYVEPDAKSGGDSVVISVHPEEGTLTDEQKQKVIEILKKNNVSTNNLTITGQSDVEHTPTAKNMFTKEHQVPEKDMADAISGVSSDNKMMVPELNKNDTGKSGKKEEIKVKEGDIKSFKQTSVDGKGGNHEKGVDSDYMKQLLSGDRTIKKHQDLDEAIKNKDGKYKMELKNGKITAATGDGKKVSEDLDMATMESLSKGKALNSGQYKLQDKMKKIVDEGKEKKGMNSTGEEKDKDVEEVDASDKKSKTSATSKSASGGGSKGEISEEKDEKSEFKDDKKKKTGVKKSKGKKNKKDKKEEK